MISDDTDQNVTEFIQDMSAKLKDKYIYGGVMDLANQIKQNQQKAYVDKTFKISSAQAHIDVNAARKFYQQVCEISFPMYLYNSFKTKWNLTGEFCTHVIDEYAKFLTILKFSDRDVCPGVWVDELWHTHMESTKLYRDTCLSLFGTIVGHKGSDLSETDQKASFENYQYTL